MLRDADQAVISPDPTNLDWQAYQAWLAAGNAPSEPAPAPVRPREVTGSQIWAALDALNQTTAWTNALSGMKRSYQDYMTSGYRDAIPESNAKVAKIAKAAGVDLKALYDSAITQAP